MNYPVADAHCDRLLPTLPAPDVTPARLRAGGVALQLFALFSGTRGPAGDPYATVSRALRAFYRLLEESQREGLVQTREAALPEGPILAMLTIEGAECLQGSLSRLHEFASAGVRAIGLTWNNENEVGHPSATGGEGLTPFGKRLIQEMEGLRIAVDVSHLSEKGFWDVERACGRFMATHSNAKALCGHHRNLSDEQIRAIIRHDGFIGVNFYPPFLVDGGREAAIADVVRHIDHIVQLGGENNVGFGSDFDGIERKPSDLNGPEHFPRLLRALGERGYGDAALRRIAGENLVRFMESI